MKEHNIYKPEGTLRTYQSIDRHLLERAAELGTILEAPCVMCDCSTMQLSVDLGNGIRGIIPRNEVCWQANGAETKDIAIITRVGKQVQFKVRDIYENERGEIIAGLSRREAQKECSERYLSSLQPGDIIPAKITHLEPFGAFCDIGCGVISLLTVDKISVSRISHPSDRFSVGESIYAVVSSVEESGRIYLSHRELLGTWMQNAAAFQTGSTVTGIIRSIEEYGVFVELAPNLAGLSELCDGAKPGDVCSVYIKSIIPERMKIKLVMIDSCTATDGALNYEKMPCRYYIDIEKVKHIDRWKYSPDGCKKNVETIFDEERCLVKE